MLAPGAWSKRSAHVARAFWKREVPPVCRSGYLLVVFGEVSEKSSALSAAECTTGRGESGELSALGGTDEDFRYLLTGKPGPQSGERRGERSGLCRF